MEEEIREEEKNIEENITEEVLKEDTELNSVKAELEENATARGY